MIELLPWGVEFDEDVWEFGDDSGEVLVSEDEDVILFGVGLGQEDEAEQEEYLD